MTMTVTCANDILLLLIFKEEEKKEGRCESDRTEKREREAMKRIGRWKRITN